MSVYAAKADELIDEVTYENSFMGTPDFAVPCLKRLVDDGNEVVGVFTQPDKPKGRGYTLTPPPVKVLPRKTVYLFFSRKHA